MKRYFVKESFYSVQGEGANAGTPAVFIRFAGCNLWTGIEESRATAKCQFCDTDFVGTQGVGGGVFGAKELAAAASERYRPATNGLVILTGGEPALQADAELIVELKRHGFAVAIETNGTVPLPAGLDWVCVSPKAGTDILVRSGDELKVVWPQNGLDLDALASLDFRHRFLSPMWTHSANQRMGNEARALLAVLQDPRWRLTTQMHKHLGIQ